MPLPKEQMLMHQACYNYSTELFQQLYSFKLITSVTAFLMEIDLCNLYKKYEKYSEQ